jgi:hypothetical protein
MTWLHSAGVESLHGQDGETHRHVERVLRDFGYVAAMHSAGVVGCRLVHNERAYRPLNAAVPPAGADGTCTSVDG